MAYVIRIPAILLIFLSIASSAAEEKAAPPRPKNFREAISIAQERAVDKDRVGALRLLQEAYKKEKRDSVAAREILKNMESLSELFLTEKAQQLHEDGRTLALSDLSQAIAKLKEAQQLEPDNVAILRSLARSYLKRGECDQVLESANLGLKVNELSESLALLKLQSLACLRRFDEFQSFLSQSESFLGSSGVFLELTRAQVAFFQEKYTMALAAAERAKAMDGDFPETYYWLGQIFTKLGKDGASVDQTYVDLCRTLDAKKRRRYEKEPRICVEEKSVEKALESKSSSL